MDDLRQFLQYFLYLFAAIAAVDMLIAWRGRHRNRRDPREAMSNLATYVVSKVWRDAVMRGIELSVLMAVSRLALYKLPSSRWAFALTVFAADFVYYWKHRAEHSVRLLWAYHSVHHSSEEFNLTTAFRLPWLGSLLSLIFYIPMVLLGFDPLAVLLARQVVLLYQFWIHSQTIGDLGWFDRVFNSPANHRVHHGSNRVYLDRNHGGILMIWDRLFGTYQQEIPAEPVVYGLTHPIGTRNPIMINLHEPIAIAKAARGANSFGEAMGYLFRNPGWRPALTPVPVSVAAGSRFEV